MSRSCTTKLRRLAKGQNLSTVAGPRLDLIKEIWEKVFPKNIQADLSCIKNARSNVHIKTPVGSLTIRFEKAIELGPKYILRRAAGISENQIQTDDEIRDELENRFVGLKVVRFRKLPHRRREVLVSFRSYQKWCAITNLRWYSRTLSIFDKKKASLLKKHQFSNKNKKRIKLMVVDRLKEWGIHGKFSFNLYDTKNNVVSLLGLKNDIRLGLFAFNSCVSKTDFLRRAYAWVRFKSNRPLKFTDKEWKQHILNISGGRIVPASYYRIVKEPQKFKCLNCDSHFQKIDVSCSKTSGVLKCPVCTATRQRNYSQQALVWLGDVSNRLGIKLITAKTHSGEKAIELGEKKTRVDGYHENGKIIFEFHGSRWHGNPTIFYVDDKPSPYSNKTALNLLIKTLKREKSFIEAGYFLVRIWDQDFLSEDRYKKWLQYNIPRIQQRLQECLE